MNKDENASGAARYYASPQEQKILVQGLLRYFSLPERSQNRNKIVKEVASYLSMLSPHWSHRAVRLWFNNNRHTYLPTMNDQQTQPNMASIQSNNHEIQISKDKISPFPSKTANLNLPPNTSNIPNMNMRNPTIPFQQQGLTQMNATLNQPISPSQQNFQIPSTNNFENAQATPFFNSSQIGQNIQSTQQPPPPFTNQIFKPTNNFMQPFQFGKQSSIQPSIQVNAPLQFNQQNQFPQQQKAISKPFSIPQNQPHTNSPNKPRPIPQSIPISTPPNPKPPILQTASKPPINNPSLSFNSDSKSSISNSNPQRNRDFYQIKTNPIQIGNGSSFSAFNTTGQNNFFYQTNEQSYIPIAAMLNEIRKLSQEDKNYSEPRLSQLISEFDRNCMQVAAQVGSIPPEKIEPMVDYVTFKFPSPAEGTNLGENIFTYSTSTNDFAEINEHSIGFGGQEANVWEQMAPNSIWQRRPFIDETLTYFENCLLTDDCFAYTSLQLGSAQRALSLKKYRGNGQSGNGQLLSTFQVEAESQIDSLCINGNFAYLLAKNNVIKMDLEKSENQKTINLDSIVENSNLAVSEGNINNFGEGSAVVSFSSTPTLFFVNGDNSVSYTMTSFPGFINISSFGIHNDIILVCTSNSPTIRLISPEGFEISAFVGHLGQVMGVEPLSENLFASRGADKTVRIWDYRSPRMITTITTPNVSTLCITGSKNFVICGLSNKNIVVTDIRKDRGKPFLGVSTQDYNAIMMKYHPDDDSLTMFGQVEKDTTKDSMIFVDTDGHSRQSILRHYSHFNGN